MSVNTTELEIDPDDLQIGDEVLEEHVNNAWYQIGGMKFVVKSIAGSLWLSTLGTPHVKSNVSKYRIRRTATTVVELEEVRVAREYLQVGDVVVGCQRAGKPWENLPGDASVLKVEPTYVTFMYATSIARTNQYRTDSLPEMYLVRRKKSDTTELWVPRAELRAGDELLFANSSPVRDAEGCEQTTNIVKIEGSLFTFRVRDTGMEYTQSGSSLWSYWLVRRAPGPSKKDFPHTCERCGKDAYVGLFETDHMYASTCPARAK